MWLTNNEYLSDIQCLTQRLFVIDVDHDDLGGQTADGQCIGNGGTDTASADNGDLVHNLSFLMCYSDSWTLLIF